MELFDLVLALMQGTLSPEQLDTAATKASMRGDPGEFMQGIEQAKPTVMAQLFAAEDLNNPNAFTAEPPVNVGKGPGEVSLGVPVGYQPPPPQGPTPGIMELVQQPGAPVRDLSQPLTPGMPAQGMDENAKRRAMMAMAAMGATGEQRAAPTGHAPIAGNASLARALVPELYKEKQQTMMPALAQYLAQARGGR